MKGLKQPDRLPRFLTNEQVSAVQADLERQVAQADTPVLRRDSLLIRAAFYLLWHGGLRVGEVEELCLQDLDLRGRAVAVRQGKGSKDRLVYLTDTAVAAVREYLGVRGQGATDHVLLYRNRPLHKDLIRSRLQISGKRAGVHISPHRLRHTFGTQLLNAGCPVTSIQRLMGHRSLQSTMIYARVHNRTVAEDYYAAMAKIEGTRDPEAVGSAAELMVIGDGVRPFLLDLAQRLAKPRLGLEERLDLVESMRHVILDATDELGDAATMQVRSDSWTEVPPAAGAW
jgi:integrase